MKRAIGAALLSFCMVTAASTATQDGGSEAGAGLARSLNTQPVHFGASPLGNEDASGGAGRRHAIDVEAVSDPNMLRDAIHVMTGDTTPRSPQMQPSSPIFTNAVTLSVTLKHFNCTGPLYPGVGCFSSEEYGGW